MSIYERDQINYSQMLQNAIANRNAAAQRQAAYEQAKGKLWGDTINNITKYAGRGIMASADQYSTDEDEAELERLLELKRQRDIESKYKEQVAQRQAVNDYLIDPYMRKQPTVTETWDGHSDVDIEDNIYRKALSRGLYA